VEGIVFYLHVFYWLLSESVFSAVAGTFCSKCHLLMRPFYIEMVNAAVSSGNSCVFNFNVDEVDVIIVESL